MSYKVFGFFAIFVFLLVGCQGGNSPTDPTVNVQPQSIGSLDSTPTSDADRFLFGLWHVEADTLSGTFTAIPARTTDLHINIVPAVNAGLKLGIEVKPGSNPPAGYFEVDFVITHPFPGLPTFTGFDMHGIILCNGSEHANGFVFPGSGDLEVQNPDGFTRWWNPTEFTDPGFFGYMKGLYAIEGPGGAPTATINPYKLFGDGLMALTDVSYLATLPLTHENARAVFRSGATNRREYDIQFPWSGGPIFYFDYAIDCSWDMPYSDPPTQIPGDFPINANAPEPFIVNASVTDSAVKGTYYGGAGSGTIELSMDIWDWQGWAVWSYDDQIGNVNLYSPDAVFETLSVTQNDVSNMTTLNILAKATEAKTGIIPVLIEITSPGTAWQQTAKAAPGGEIASYTFVEVDVTEMTCEGDLNVNCDDAIPINPGESILGAVCMPHDPSDYYVFTVPSGQVMTGTIDLENFLASDNDLILYDGCPGDPIGFAITSGTSAESLDVGTLESGFYYISVLPGELAGDGVQDYELTLNINLAGGNCTTDDNNDSGTASQINLVGSYPETVCAGNDLRDWYKISVPPDKTAGGTLYLHNNSGGNIDVNIYEAYPGDPAYVGNNAGTMDEYVIVTALSPGTHYIEVESIGADPEGDRDYSFDLELYTSDFVCSGGDGNDSYLTADVVPFVYELSDSVCFPADPDWFRFTVAEDTIVTGFISITSGLIYNNDLYMFTDPSGEPIESSASPGNVDEQINVGSLNPGVYYIYVAAHPLVGGGDQSYTMTVNLEAETTGNFDFKIHAHIIRQNDGSNPATNEARVQNDVAWANEFYSQWGMSISLVEISYINKTSWLSGSGSELYTCHSIYRDKSGPVNVYYCNNFPDIPSAAAWCRMDCRPQFQTHNSTFIAMSDYAVDRVLAHELGHGIGILHDMYLFDLGYSTCSQIKYNYCAAGTDFSYCNKADATYGNLMWWSIEGWYDPEDYWLSDTGWEVPNTPINSQMENLQYFHIQYPNNF